MPRSQNLLPSPLFASRVDYAKRLSLLPSSTAHSLTTLCAFPQQRCRKQPQALTMSPPSRQSGHRSTNSNIKKTEVLINVYDLLPPGRLSSCLWTIGASLLHTGVVIGDKEYAFGGHDRPDVTGVYWTKPKTEPPGGTWKCEILHGFTYAMADEMEEIVRDVRCISPNLPGARGQMLTQTLWR
jgi:hypothetical protein